MKNRIYYLHPKQIEMKAIPTFFFSVILMVFSGCDTGFHKAQSDDPNSFVKAGADKSEPALTKTSRALPLDGPWMC